MRCLVVETYLHRKCSINYKRHMNISGNSKKGNKYEWNKKSLLTKELDHSNLRYYGLTNKKLSPK